jgi:hypothetical protein
MQSTQLCFHRRGPCLLCQQTVLTQCILNITNNKLAISEIELMEQLLTILLKIRTIQCLEISIPLSNLCYVYPPPFLEHSSSLYNVSDPQCMALRPRSYKTVLRDHRRMRHVLRHVLHSQSFHVIHARF